MSEWKLAMPAAENWQELTDALDKAQPHPKGKVTIKGDGVGLRWRFNKDVLEKVAAVLGVTFSIEVADVRSMMGPGGGMDGGKLKYQWLESLGGAFGYQIHVNPLLSPETANLAIWHEIQHMFQLEEGRMKPFDLTYNVNLPITNENAEKYMTDPTEVDADQMALNLHKLQQYSTVIPVSQLEGSEGPYFAELLEEGWPFQEAVDEIDTMVRENEIGVDEWMAGRNLQPQSKIAMPYYNNVWYHVTSVDKLDNISKQGLLPRMESGERTNWPAAGVPADALYFWPSISQARSYFQWLKFPESGKHVILRVHNLDLTKVAPDHEEFARWLDDRWENDVNWPQVDPDELNKLYQEVLSQSNTAHEISQDANDNSFSTDQALEILAELTPQLRQSLAQELSESGEPIMYYGSVSPSQIEVAFMYTQDQLEQLFIEQRQSEGKPTQPEDDNEEDWYEELDQFMAEAAGNVQIVDWLDFSEIEKIIEEAHDDTEDKYESDFAYTPLNQWQGVPEYGPTKTPEPSWQMGYR
jgi:hypothetical protein